MKYSLDMKDLLTIQFWTIYWQPKLQIYITPGCGRTLEEAKSPELVDYWPQKAVLNQEVTELTLNWRQNISINKVTGRFIRPWVQWEKTSVLEPITAREGEKGKSGKEAGEQESQLILPLKQAQIHSFLAPQRNKRSKQQWRHFADSKLHFLVVKH